VLHQHGDRAERVLGGGHCPPSPVVRDVEAGEDRVFAELVGEPPPSCSSRSAITTFAPSATKPRACWRHATGTARDNHCLIIKTCHH